MHISPEHAALIAQVYPTLLIALILEGRYGPRGRGVRWFNLAHHFVRLLAIVGTIGSTFACLTIARSGQTEVFTDWMVLITHYLLVAAFAAMAGNVMGKEWHMVRADFGRKEPAEPEPSESPMRGSEAVTSRPSQR